MEAGASLTSIYVNVLPLSVMAGLYGWIHMDYDVIDLPLRHLSTSTRQCVGGKNTLVYACDSINHEESIDEMKPETPSTCSRPRCPSARIQMFL